MVQIVPGIGLDVAIIRTTGKITRFSHGEYCYLRGFEILEAGGEDIRDRILRRLEREIPLAIVLSGDVDVPPETVLTIGWVSGSEAQYYVISIGGVQ